MKGFCEIESLSSDQPLISYPSWSSLLVAETCGRAPFADCAEQSIMIDFVVHDFFPAICAVLWRVHIVIYAVVVAFARITATVLAHVQEVAREIPAVFCVDCAFEFAHGSEAATRIVDCHPGTVLRLPFEAVAVTDEAVLDF